MDLSVIFFLAFFSCRHVRDYVNKEKNILLKNWPHSKTVLKVLNYIKISGIHWEIISFILLIIFIFFKTRTNRIEFKI